MIESIEEIQNKRSSQKSPTGFFTKIFKWKKLCVKSCKSNIDTLKDVESEFTKNSYDQRYLSRSIGSIPSVNNLSVAIPPSPALSIPSKYKDVNTDMEALRLSRQDDPFLKVLASKESLDDSAADELVPEKAIRSPGLTLDVDPLSVPEFHKHMVRSPPPVTWPRTPVFRFQFSSQDHLEGKKTRRIAHHVSCELDIDDVDHRFISPDFGLSSRVQRSSSAEAKDRRTSSGTFSILNPSSLRSFSEIRRLHGKDSEESQYLVAPSS